MRFLAHHIAVHDAQKRRVWHEVSMSTPMLTYAQNFEDVMIARLFEAGYRGFYVDIGAAHPEHLSVSCHFYKHGWSGINVEPSPHFFPLLCAARPNDTVRHRGAGGSRLL
jgi:hypothetical protein